MRPAQLADLSARRAFLQDVDDQLLGVRVSFHKNNYEALKKADALLVCTEWNEFRHPNFQRIKAELKQPLIFDGRNLYDPKLMKALDIKYYSVGRELISPGSTLTLGSAALQSP